MTKRKVEEIKCPCGQKIMMECYHSVNVTLNPELKETVLTNEINTTICPNCEKKIYLSIPFLYHDMKNKLFIWVYPEQTRAREEEIRRNIEKQRDEIQKWLDERKNVLKVESIVPLQVVFGVDELKAEVLKADS